MHYKQCSSIPTNIILKGDVPSKVLQCYLSYRCSPLDTNVCMSERLLVGNKISDTLAKLEYLGFIKIKVLECVFCVFQHSLELRFVCIFFSLHVLLLFVLIFLMKQFHSLFLYLYIIRSGSYACCLKFYRRAF